MNESHVPNPTPNQTEQPTAMNVSAVDAPDIVTVADTVTDNLIDTVADTDIGNESTEASDEKVFALAGGTTFHAETLSISNPLVDENDSSVAISVDFPGDSILEAIGTVGVGSVDLPVPETSFHPPNDNLICTGASRAASVAAADTSTTSTTTPTSFSTPLTSNKTTTDSLFRTPNASISGTLTATSKPELLSVPLDSLHYIASFLTPSEFNDGFCLINKTSHIHCREIIRRVKLHAFKCASEVVSAWKVGQWEDARELAALYVSAGVPIYSRCLGHSFHTLNWRMKIEATEFRTVATAVAASQNEQQSESDDMVTGNKASLSSKNGDEFFGTARSESRATDQLDKDLTYLEEKCLFWSRRMLSSSSRSSSRSSSGNRNHSPTPNQRHRQRDHMGEEVNRRSTSPPQLRTTLAVTPTDVASRQRIPLIIHRHLLDRHTLGEASVNDQDGRMIAPMVVLSADFFHPSARINIKPKPTVDNNVPYTIAEDLEAIDSAISENPSLLEGPSFVAATNNDDLQPPPIAHSVSFQSSDLASMDHPASKPKSLLPSSVDLEVYSSSIASSLESLENGIEIRRHLRSRFGTYQCRLETFLVKGDAYGYDECILDFWDEFFPQSAGIHYFDLQSPVPRLSSMAQFLTKPCPKAIGVVQCEIERIKRSARGNGVKFKGHLFPTYEYRLFIRNRSLLAANVSQDGTIEVQPDLVRRDTVLMVAKNRGRKHTEPGDATPTFSTNTKKGSNNYYLYLPQQMDVDDHFNQCNEHLTEPSHLEPNGASRYPTTTSDKNASKVLGRLQSNFIGTEFQIYTPHLRKPTPRHIADKSLLVKTQPVCSDDDEVVNDSEVSSDNTRRAASRFGRFRRTTGSTANLGQGENSNGGSVGNLFVSDRPKVKRVLSAPETPEHSRRQPRINRRAIANDAMLSPQATMHEEEDGAITYTANLLGSRPRIMDVCIPRVTVEGIPGVDWKRFLEACSDAEDGRMLSCFRQLQQRRENQEPNNLGPNDGDADDTGSGAGDEETDFGLMGLQNRPPWWNVELGSFVLNFGGRVSVASVKNFQLCERSNQDLIMLQFGRIQGRHSFTMDFQHPLTAVQAFSIAISSLQSKLSFG